MRKALLDGICAGSGSPYSINALAAEFLYSTGNTLFSHISEYALLLQFPTNLFFYG